ncbi:MAG: hypothetical protein Kow00107_04030 [Planctomycetota bacterium]
MQQKRPLFTGNGTPRRWRREDKIAPKGAMKRIDHILWVGVFLVCSIFVFKVMFIKISPAIPDNPEAAVSFLKQKGPAGYAAIAQHLADPRGDKDKALRYLKLIPHVDCPELREQMYLALSSQTEGNCLLSLALCILNDEKGIPRIIEIIKTAKPGDSKFCMDNYFMAENKEENPLISTWGCNDDLYFATRVLSSTIAHNFPGESWEERKANILEWWESHKGTGMRQWMLEFLSSPEAENRAMAFNHLYVRTWEEPELVKVLESALRAEQSSSLQNFMAMKLFRIGSTESIPYFDVAVRSAKTAEEKASVLAVFKHFVHMPTKFHEIDTWRDGRDDNISYQFVVEWWNDNYRFLEFQEDTWYPRSTSVAQ